MQSPNSSTSSPPPPTSTFNSKKRFSLGSFRRTKRPTQPNQQSNAITTPTANNSINKSFNIPSNDTDSSTIKHGRNNSGHRLSKLFIRDNNNNNNNTNDEGFLDDSSTIITPTIKYFNNISPSSNSSFLNNNNNNNAINSSDNRKFKTLSFTNKSPLSKTFKRAYTKIFKKSQVINNNEEPNLVIKKTMLHDILPSDSEDEVDENVEEEEKEKEEEEVVVVEEEENNHKDNTNKEKEEITNHINQICIHKSLIFHNFLPSNKSNHTANLTIENQYSEPITSSPIIILDYINDLNLKYQ